MVVVHGGGLINTKRIEEEFKSGNTEGKLRYSNEEFKNLLEGKLPNNEEIDII